MTAPGRFPTTVHDPGLWWASVDADGFAPERWSANAAWWRLLCSRAGVETLVGDSRGLRRRLSLARLGRAANSAGAALGRLQRRETFETAERYVDALAPVARYLRLLRREVGDLEFTFEGGVEVNDLAYDSSRALVDAARDDGPLTRLADLVAAEYPTRTAADLDLLVVPVTLPEDLLLVMAVIERLRRRGRRIHACLADHGHENFTLRPHLDRLRAAGTLDSVFDTIVEAKDERDAVVPALARALAAGAEVRGYLTTASATIAGHLTPMPVASPPTVPQAAPPVPTFTPEPILVTRLSPRRCYWARCSFCIHNEKYDDRRPPSTAEVPAAVDALERWLAGGYRIVNFNDEALSPALLRALCDEIDRRGIATRHPDFSWICRSKLELAFGADLFARMRRAGCAEVLFGLESASPRVRRLMDKEVKGLDRRAIRRILRAAGAAGIGVHVNVIAGFPGERVDELADTIEFVAQAVFDQPRATYLVNRFVVFPATPVAVDPASFGIELVPPTGDMPAMIAYRPGEAWAEHAWAIGAHLPQLRAWLDDALGWGWFTADPDRAAAMRLIFGTGHGTLLKAREVELPPSRSRRSAVA